MTDPLPEDQRLVGISSKAYEHPADRAATYPFQAAVQLDTAFSLAYYRQSLAAEWLGRDSLAQRAAEAAARFDRRLSEHDRRLVRALLARRAFDLTQAERLYREVVDNYPDDVEAWLQLGELLFQGNPLRGRSATESRAAFERVLALDPDNEEALVHLARIASIEGRREDLVSLPTCDGGKATVRAFQFGIPLLRMPGITQYQVDAKPGGLVIRVVLRGGASGAAVLADARRAVDAELASIGAARTAVSIQPVDCIERAGTGAKEKLVISSA